MLVAGLPLFEGLPNPGLASHIVATNDLRLLDSLRYVCGVATPALGGEPTALYRTLDAARAQCQKGLRLRGPVYALHNELVEAVRSQDLDRVGALVDVAPALHFTTNELRVLPLTAAGKNQPVEDQLYLSTMRRENSSEYAKPFDVLPPDGDPDVVVSDVREVLSRLRDVDPVSAAEFDALVTDVVVMSSGAINGGTSFKAFGYLLLRERDFQNDWTNYLETLVHEAAHLYLYCLWSIDPIITDDGGRMYKSPLRVEPRPLSGIFHAMFVLARIIRTISRFRSDSRYREDISRMGTAYNSARNKAPLAEKFEDAFAVVTNNAVLSPLGLVILDGCRAMVDDST